MIGEGQSGISFAKQKPNPLLGREKSKQGCQGKKAVKAFFIPLGAFIRG